MLSCCGRWARTPIPSNRTPLFIPTKLAANPACVPALPVAWDDMIDTQPRGVGLREQFYRRVDITERLAHQELELARLVAAGGEPRAIVALDPNLRAA